MPSLKTPVLAASVLMLALVSDVSAARSLLEVPSPVPVSVPISVPVDPVVVEPGTVSVGVGGDPLVTIEAGAISVGSDPAPTNTSAPEPTSAPTPASGSGAGNPVAATDSQGVSKNNNSASLPASSVIDASSGQTVSAQGANGVRITKVTYITKNIHRTGRVTMIVTLKDRRGLLVRGAKVRIRGVARTTSLTLKGAQMQTTSKLGQATFSFKLDRRVRGARSAGKRFEVASIASTATASTSLVTSFAMPPARASK